MKPEERKRLFNKDVPFITYIIHDKNMKNGRTVTVYKPTQEYYILFELIKFRRLPSTFPDIGITVISEGLEPSPSDVSVTESVLMDIKTGKSVEIEELETVVEHLQIRLSEWRGVARQLADELKEEISSKCTVIWEEVGETSPAWIAYNNLVDTEDYETNPDYYKGV